MKISKIILYSYSAFIVLILLGFLVIGLTNKEVTYADNVKIEKVKMEHKVMTLEKFNHLSMASGCQLSIRKGGNSEVYFTHNPEIESIMPELEVKNDTLFINSTRFNNGNWIQLKVDHLSSITSKEGNVSISDFVCNDLSIEAENTNIRMNNSAQVKHLELKLRNKSRFNGSQYKGECLVLDVNDSEALVYGNNQLASVSGRIMKNSHVRLPNTLKINMESDKTSKITMQ